MSLAVYTKINMKEGEEGRKEMFYLTTHSTHFIYGYMASDIWLRTILIVKGNPLPPHRLNAKTSEVSVDIQQLGLVIFLVIFLFNDTLNTFYLWLYGVRHPDSEKGNPLPPHRLLLSINSKGSFICTIPQTG